jgi:AraC family transcriptional regulator
MVATMKPQTHSYYEAKVRAALRHILQRLDEALDLGALAQDAALSPLHFHRIFRGMVGETPLEIHRRLRLERAAAQLSSTDAPVTCIAFDAGYETHESFTRAFRAAFAMAPSEFRDKARQTHLARQFGGADCNSQSATLLPARIAIHHLGGDIHLPEPLLFEGENPVNVQIKTMPELLVASLAHRGTYNTIGETFARLGAVAGPAGLVSLPGARMIAIYHDDPETTAPADLRSDAGLIVPATTPIPAGLRELRLPAGDYAKATHIGPYAMLGDVWARFMGQWLPASGRRMTAAGQCFELYLNDPSNTAPEALQTDLYVPLEP